ncbi:MAG: MFS transporter [Candidatus Nitrospinota bacterium M3_3B_026]
MAERAPRAILGWALYDFANTIFSMNVVSRYFPLWVTVDHGAPDIYYSIALSSSMLLMAVTAPVLGALSDQTGRRVRPLALTTIVCVTATAAISGVSSLWAGLALFVAANYMYNASLVFYDALLPAVARGTSVPTVAGYGVGLGYIGAIAGLLAVLPVAENYGRTAAFAPTAALFFLFSLPLFAWVRDERRGAFERMNVMGAFRRVAETFRQARSNRDLFIFLLANFFILDGVNTVIAFMSVYADKVIGLSGGRLTVFFVLSTLGAAAGSLFWGRLSNRFGPLSALKGVLGTWVFTLFWAAVSFNEAVFWLVGPLAGVAIGGVWVCGRSLLVRLSPPGRVGEMFGLFNLAGKAASITGPMVWGVIVMVFSPLGGTAQYRLAVLSLALFIVAGWLLLSRIKNDGGL